MQSELGKNDGHKNFSGPLTPASSGGKVFPQELRLKRADGACGNRHDCPEEKLLTLGKQYLSELGDRWQKRVITILLHKVPLEIEVCDAAEEAELRTSAIIRNVTTGLVGGLPEYPWETAMRSHPLSGEPSPLQGLVAPMVAAGEMALKHISEHDARTFLDVEHVLTKKHGFHQQLDHSAILDLAYIRWVNNVGAKQRLESLVLDCLPSPDKCMSTSQSLAELQNLEKEEFISYLPHGLAASLGAAKEMVAGLECEIAPKVDSHLDDFTRNVVDRFMTSSQRRDTEICFCLSTLLSKAVSGFLFFFSVGEPSVGSAKGVHPHDRLAYFLSYATKNSENEDVTFRGPEAMALLWDGLMVEKRELTVSILAPFHAYRWMLSLEQCDVVDGLTKDLLLSEAPPMDAGMQIERRGAKRKSAHDAEAETMLLFR